VRLEDGGGPELAEKLHAGEVHLTLSAAPSAPIEMFETVHLGQLAFIAVATREFLAPSDAPVEIGEVLRHLILTLNGRHASREVFDAACRLSGAVPRVVLESSSPHTLFSMAEGGNGVAVVPSSARPASEALVGRPVALRGQPLVFDICAMHDSRVPLPAYGRRFIDDLRAHILAEEAGADESPASPRGHLHVV
jgi:DNA-binding transcriptional LysR family regulator